MNVTCLRALSAALLLTFTVACGNDDDDKGGALPNFLIEEACEKN